MQREKTIKSVDKNANKIPVIINCDTGIDDAVAILIAVKSRKLNIKLISTDVGNTNPSSSAVNTTNILELIKAPEIPVVAGNGKCFKKERPRVAVHGNGGLGEYIFEETDRFIDEGDAVEKIYETLCDSTEKITIICLSPPTNIAKLLTKHKDAAEKIERIVLMAGTIEKIPDGEMPYPEFNIATDPEAGEVLFKSKIKIDVVPMEMGHTAYLTCQDVFKTKIANFTGQVLEVVFRSYKDRHVKNGIATHDGCAVAYVTNPELFETQPAHAEVKYFDSIKTGILTMSFDKEPNITTCTKVDIKKFRKLYFKCLKRCK